MHAGPWSSGRFRLGRGSPGRRLRRPAGRRRRARYYAPRLPGPRRRRRGRRGRLGRARRQRRERGLQQIRNRHHQPRRRGGRTTGPARLQARRTGGSTSRPTSSTRTRPREPVHATPNATAATWCRDVRCPRPAGPGALEKAAGFLETAIVGLGGGRRSAPLGSAVMTSGDLAVVIAGVRARTGPGGAADPRESTREPNGPLCTGGRSAQPSRPRRACRRGPGGCAAFRRPSPCA